MSLHNRLHTDTAVPGVIIVIGPTASGKSELAVRIAEEVDGEIVNADSMQCYSQMAIGTARPSPELMARVPHHLFAIVAPDINFTAADYRKAGRRVIKEISSRGRVPVVVGGTGLYVRVLMEGIADSPAGDDKLRKDLTLFAERQGNQALHARLAAIDPESAARLHTNDRLRLIRAIEVFHQSGRPFSELQATHGFGESWCDSLKIGINLGRHELYERIDRRVDQMLAAGFEEEVRTLLQRGYHSGLKAMGAIGYREMCEHLAGGLSLLETIELIKRNTRRYAKRQLTWFKKDGEIKWVEYPVGFGSIQKITNDFFDRRRGL